MSTYRFSSESQACKHTGLGTSAVIGAGAGAAAAKAIPLQGRTPALKSYAEDRPHGNNMSRIYAQQYVSEFGSATVQSGLNGSCR